MTEITFVTSNQTKLAHARYLCRNYHVSILSYKKFYYGVGYEEPRIYDRNQLLTDSFYDAADRWRKNVSGSDDRLFFIEDTSMRLDALSDDKNEVPGVDVKFWMRGMTFDKLDYELKLRGNNRKCSVTSHLILFLTEDLKRELGTVDDYRIFKSTAYGTVVEKEEDFDTNILYPWLDNKTFNKWFVPEGFDLPVSMLDISEADAGDFRKGAFEDMLEFLKENNAIKPKKKIVDELFFQFYDCFIICGRTCAGKSTIGKYLVDEYGYYHIEASEFVTHKRLETHGTTTRVDKHVYAAKLLEVEPVFVVNRLIEYMHDKNIHDKFVITGFRTKDEIETFQNCFHSDRLRLVFVDSSFDERFRRWMLRQRDVDNYTKDRFHEIDVVQEEMGVGEITKIPEMMLLSNNSNDIQVVYKDFRKIILGHEIKRDPVCFSKRELNSNILSLGKLILIILALEYQKDESKSFTTTEISHLLNNFFKVKRSKNNVSRYFNQAYYVYYEVKYENRKNRYKISPIGYSEAMMILRHLKHVCKSSD